MASPNTSDAPNPPPSVSARRAKCSASTWSYIALATSAASVKNAASAWPRSQGASSPPAAGRPATFAQRCPWRRPDGPWEELVVRDELVLRADLAGIDPYKDVQITVTDHTLGIRAERHEKKEATEKGRYRSEFRNGTFERRVALPAGVSEHDVKATYEDGILEVRFPIDGETSEAKKISVQRV
jgi:HSP20 family protein